MFVSECVCVGGGEGQAFMETKLSKSCDKSPPSHPTPPHLSRVKVLNSAKAVLALYAHSKCSFWLLQFCA